MCDPCAKGTEGRACSELLLKFVGARPMRMELQLLVLCQQRVVQYGTILQPADSVTFRTSLQAVLQVL